MELNKTDCQFTHLSKIFETSVEQSIDTDFTLPDYYPEVSKILKCLTEVSILNCKLQENTIMVGGQAVITLLYSDSENNINSFTHVFPFNKNVDGKEPFVDCFTENSVRLNYINSKAVAPRKIEVHGSAAISIIINKINTLRVLELVDCDNIYIKQNDFNYIQPQQPIEKSIFVEDEISVGQNKPFIDKIIRSSAVSRITECKTVSGKTVIKGEIDINVLYCAKDNNRPIMLAEHRGFSQIIDGVFDENECNCDIFSKVVSFELHPKTSLDGEVKSLSFEAKVNINIFPYINTKKRLVCDAISGGCIADIVTVALPIEQIKERIKENFVCQKRIDLTGGAIDEIHDLWCRADVDFTTCEKNELLIKGIITIYVIGKNSDGEPAFFERTVEYEYRGEIDEINGEIRCRPQISVVAVNYSLDSELGLDVSVELMVCATVYTVNEITVLKNIQIDESNKVNRDKNAAVILYFAEDESVWQIAKKYAASPDKICKANSIEDYDIKCNKIILIPNI